MQPSVLADNEGWNKDGQMKDKALDFQLKQVLNPQAGLAHGPILSSL